MLASAGPQAYAAIARQAGSARVGRGHGVAAASPASLPSLQTIAPLSLGAPLRPATSPEALPALSYVGATAAAQEQAAETTLNRLAAPLPEFSSQGDDEKGSAEEDFLRRIGLRGEIRLKQDSGKMSERPDGDGGVLFRSRLSLARDKGVKMPERPEELDDAPRRRAPADEPGGVDPLGNPPRDPSRDDGPDGTDDGGLFKSMHRQGGWVVGPAMSLTLVAVGAIAFAGFGALGLPALAWGSSLLALVNAVPLLGAALSNDSQASIWLPALAAVALPFGASQSGPPPSPPSPEPDGQKPVELIVVLKNSARTLAADSHLSFIDLSVRNGVKLYTKMALEMSKQLDAAGLSSRELAERGAAPIATYRRINATTLRVLDPARAADLRTWLESQGHAVYDNARRQIVRPVPPPADEALRRNAVTPEDNLKITGADAVQQLARQRYGAPEMGLMGRLAMKLVGLAIPEVRHAVIDTGIDGTLPWLKGVVEKNVTTQPGGGDDGHGSWTENMVIFFAPWLRKTATHYKTFVKGNATLDDVLKALTMAANDGNLVISNSWGDDEGDPYSPDSQLVRKLAQEGHIMVFAAGNAGPRPNTVGNPGGVYYRDAKTGALRVLSIPAAKRDKEVDSFSSRGPRPRKVKDVPDYPHVPTGPTAIGSNVESGWPKDFGPDRIDPVYGPVKAEWGTSMATPAVAGAIVLLCMMFGVTATGEKLDAIVNAVMATLEKTGQSPDAEGEGFLNVAAAYKALEAVMQPVVPGLAARLAMRLVGGR